MLPRSQRLSGEQLKEVIKNGRASHSSLFVLRFLKVAGKTKLSAVAPIKIAKISSARNLIRRRIYEAAKDLIGKIENQHIVAMAKQGIEKADFKAVENDLKSNFVKAGLLK